jgi:hypothetical protein
MKWTRDPFVLAGAVIAVLFASWAMFAGNYYPGIDWSNHLALIAILTNGDETGATQYFVRSWVPTPYLLFYLLSAGFGQFMPVDVAAKLVIALSSGLWVIAGAHLAEATGRSPRLGLFLPLALFSVSMGWGFGSFVFTSPLLFFALGSAERMFAEPSRRKILETGFAVAAVYLGHGLLVATLVLMLGIRALALAVARRSPRVIWHLALSGVPTAFVAVPAVLSFTKNPWIETGAKSVFDFPPFAERVGGIGGNLLERGSSEHWTVMWIAAGVFVALLILSIVRRGEAQKSSSWGMETYAGLLSAFYFFGPMTLGTVWFVYPRYAALAAAAVFLLPRVHLRGALGAAVCVVALGLGAWNAKINRQHVIAFSEMAKPFDRVRSLIPPKSRVMPLTIVGAGDLATRHHALGSLYFYLFVDGASFTPFVFDYAGLPVYHRKDVKHPRAPFWRVPDSFDPRTHGVDYDYLLLRGEGLIKRTTDAGLHELVENVSGWAVFRTKAPPPRPN